MMINCTYLVVSTMTWIVISTICMNLLLCLVSGVVCFLTVYLLQFLVVVNVVSSLNIKCFYSEERVPFKQRRVKIFSMKQKNWTDSELDSSIRTIFMFSISVRKDAEEENDLVSLLDLGVSLKTLCFLRLADRQVPIEDLPRRFHSDYQIFFQSTFTRQRSNGQIKG